MAKFPKIVMKIPKATTAGKHVKSKSGTKSKMSKSVSPKPKSPKNSVKLLSGKSQKVVTKSPKIGSKSLKAERKSSKTGKPPNSAKIVAQKNIIKVSKVKGKPLKTTFTITKASAKLTKTTLKISKTKQSKAQAKQKKSTGIHNITKATSASGKTTGKSPIKSTGKSPKATGKSPKTTVKSPKVAGKSPKSTGKSKAIGKSPKAAGKSPKAAGKSPKAAGTSPKAAGKSPKAAGKSPIKHTGKSPKATEKSPKAIETVSVKSKSPKKSTKRFLNTSLNITSEPLKTMKGKLSKSFDESSYTLDIPSTFFAVSSKSVNIVNTPQERHESFIIQNGSTGSERSVPDAPRFITPLKRHMDSTVEHSSTSRKKVYIPEEEEKQHCRRVVDIVETLSMADDDKETRENIPRHSNSKFEEIRYTESFVDKSLLIRTFLETNVPDNVVPGVIHDCPVIIVTAPPGFGKTTNLNMLQKFLEVKVVNKLPRFRNPYDNENHKLFVGLNIMQPEYEELCVRHFGQHPVIRVDMKCSRKFFEIKDGVMFLKDVIHRAYVEHEYLVNSADLSEAERTMCRVWCAEDYRCLREELIDESLKNLSVFLFRHFNMKIFALVDDFDSVVLINDLVPLTKPSETMEINSLCWRMLSSLLRGNACMERALVTGTSHMAVVRFCLVVQGPYVCRFLSNHKFVPYYGFTDDEIETVFENLALSRSQKKTARDRCENHHSSDGKLHLYNMYSIVKYLKSSALEGYGQDSKS